MVCRMSWIMTTPPSIPPVGIGVPLFSSISDRVASTSMTIKPSAPTRGRTRRIKPTSTSWVTTCVPATPLLITPVTRATKLTYLNKAVGIIQRRELRTANDLKPLRVLQCSQQQTDRIAGGTEHEATVPEIGTGCADTEVRQSASCHIALPKGVQVGCADVIEIESGIG